MTDLLTRPLDELRTRHSAAANNAEQPDVMPYAIEARDALDALIRLRERIAERGLEEAVYGGEPTK